MCATDTADLHYQEVKKFNKKDLSISIADRLDGEDLDEFTKKMSGEVKSYKLSKKELNKLLQSFEKKKYQSRLFY